METYWARWVGPLRVLGQAGTDASRTCSRQKKKEPVVTESYGHYQIMRILDMTMKLDVMTTESGLLQTVLTGFLCILVLPKIFDFRKRLGTEIHGHNCLYLLQSPQ